MRRALVVLAMLLLMAPPPVASYSVPERGGVVYQVMVDRFYDGNQSNNRPFYDPSRTNYRLYWGGGDLEGLTEKLDYIKSLGVSMIWVSPPLNDNVNGIVSGSAPPTTATGRGTTGA